MVIQEFEQRGLLLNVAFVDGAGDPGTLAFRGRLALVEGEVGDATGNRKPPAIVMEQVVLLSAGEQLTLLAGSLDRLQDLPALVGMYKSALTPTTLAIIYVVNLTAPAQIALEGTRFALIPMREGVVWNELMDAAHLEKSELKNLSSGAKVMAVYAGLKSDFKAKGEAMTLDKALTLTADIKRVERGAL